MKLANRNRGHSSVLFNEGYAQACSQPSIVTGAGASVYDAEGREYLDTANGAGSILLGHAHPKVVTAIQERIARGTIFTAPCQEAVQYAELLNTLMPWHEGFIFANSGSEATLRAIRLARAHTGRDRVAIFSGGWHGSHDQVLFEEHPGSTEETPVLLPKCAGIPAEVAKHLLMLPYNHRHACELIKTHRNELALVLVEPTQGSNPRDDVASFLHEIRDVSRESGILFGLDEVITGGRLGLGGGQEYYGVTADVATFGKTLGGGFPIGVLGINAALCETVARSGQRGGVFMGGTFSGNPVSTLAGQTVMTHMQETATDGYQKLDKWGTMVMRDLNDYCQDHGFPAHLIGVASIFRVIFCADKIRSRHERDQKELSMKEQESFYQFLLEAGVHVGTNRINFLSLGYDDKSVRRLVDSYKLAFEQFYS